MLKKFFISMLGSMAALWLSLFIFVVGLFFLISAIVAKNFDTAKLVSDSILYIELKGSIPDRVGNLTVTDVIMGEGLDNDALEDILYSIEQGANDPRIKGIYLDCKQASLGLASRSEIIEALKKFKSAGKWVWAYADEFSQGDYYVASIADEIYLNPVGMLEIKGLGSTTLFFKDLLEKVGVDVQVVKVGSYKSAVEPFTRMDMSEPSREQTQQYIDELWDVVTGTISSSRGISASTLNMWADSTMALKWDASRFVTEKALTGVKYRSQVEDQLRSKLGLKADDELPLITPTEYAAANFDKTQLAMRKPHVAVYYCVGDIVEDDGGGIASSVVVPDILKLAKDDNVKGLVLRVNSGGGSAFASEQIWKALEDFKATGKPLYVSMGDYAASGGYYISCNADCIYADPSTLTGSIGIFGMLPNAHNLMTDKIGLGMESVATSPNALFPSLMDSASTEQLAALQSYVERGYDTFVSRVAQGRKLSVDSVNAIGGGRVWTGVAASQLGLVDQLGTLDDAVQAMIGKTNVGDGAVVAYPQNDIMGMDLLLKMASGNANIQLDKGIISNPEAQQIIRASQQVQNVSTLQARMPYIIIQ